MQTELARQQELNLELSQALKGQETSLDMEKLQRLANELEAQLVTVKQSEQKAWQRVKQLEGVVEKQTTQVAKLNVKSLNLIL